MSPIPITVTFNEPMYNFALGDFTVVGGTVDNFAGSDGDDTFTADVTPSADGEVSPHPDPIITLTLSPHPDPNPNPDPSPSPNPKPDPIPNPNLEPNPNPNQGAAARGPAVGGTLRQRPRQRLGLQPRVRQASPVPGTHRGCHIRGCTSRALIPGVRLQPAPRMVAACTA